MHRAGCRSLLSDLQDSRAPTTDLAPWPAHMRPAAVFREVCARAHGWVGGWVGGCVTDPMAWAALFAHRRLRSVQPCVRASVCKVRARLPVSPAKGEDRSRRPTVTWATSGASLAKGGVSAISAAISIAFSRSAVALPCRAERHGRAVPGRAVPCRAVPRCAALCCAVLRSAAAHARPACTFGTARSARPSVLRTKRHV